MNYAHCEDNNKESIRLQYIFLIPLIPTFLNSKYTFVLDQHISRYLILRCAFQSLQTIIFIYIFKNRCKIHPHSGASSLTLKTATHVFEFKGIWDRDGAPAKSAKLVLPWVLCTSTSQTLIYMAEVKREIRSDRWRVHI